MKRDGTAVRRSIQLTEVSPFGAEEGKMNAIHVLLKDSYAS